MVSLVILCRPVSRLTTLFRSVVSSLSLIRGSGRRIAEYALIQCSVIDRSKLNKTDVAVNENDRLASKTLKRRGREGCRKGQAVAADTLQQRRR